MLIGLIGKAGSGKTLLANALCSERNFEHYSFGAELKEMLIKAGLITKKGLVQKGYYDRWIMQIIATNLIRNQIDPDFWVKRLAKKIGEVGKKDIVVDDVRFRNEADWIKSNGGYLIRIKRKDGGSIISPDINKKTRTPYVSDLGNFFIKVIMKKVDFQLTSHRSEMEMEEIFADATINNNGIDPKAFYTKSIKTIILLKELDD